MRSHFLKQPLAPCLGTTRHKILADDKISMFQQRPLLRKCLSDGIFTSYFEWKDKTAKEVYFGSLVNNKETKKMNTYFGTATASLSLKDIGVVQQICSCFLVCFCL